MTVKDSGSATSGFLKGASRGGLRPPTVGHNAWPHISWRSCSRPATRREPARRLTGGRWDRRLDLALMGSCSSAAGLLHWSPDVMPRWPQGDGRRSLSSVSRGCRMRNALELVDVDSDRLEEVLRRAEQSLDEKDAELIRAVFESYAYVTDLVEDKNTTIRRLRQLFFGSRTEKTEAVVGPKTETSRVTASPDAAAGTESAAGKETTDVSNAATLLKGHGRNGAEAYQGAVRINAAHPSLQAGDACPACGEGTVYEKTPGMLVRITGQPPLAATVYHLQKLRCHLCGQVFTADPPQAAGDQKYDATAGSMIGLLKYGSGLPFNRLDGLQGDLGVPLPASTQWDVVEAVAASLTPAFDELIRQAAQGEVVHNDDTTVKILGLMGQRARQVSPPASGRFA